MFSGGMKRIQRGATLLEAILAAAVMGVIMAYTGQQALQYAQRKTMEERAQILANNNRIYRDFFATLKQDVNVPVDGRDFVLNWFWTQDISATANKFFEEAWGFHNRYFIRDTLTHLKLETCTRDGGTLNENMRSGYIECGKYGSAGTIAHRGMYIFVKPYDSIAFPEVKSRPFVIQNYYTVSNVAFWDDMIQTAIRIPEIKFEDGFRIEADDIYIAAYGRFGSAWLPEEDDLRYRLDNYLNGDITGFNEFKTRVVGSRKVIGMFIELDIASMTETLKTDGSTSMEEDASLCWSNLKSDNLPCISAIFNEANPDENAILIQNNVKIDGDLIYKDATGNYRTPIIADYHTFDGNDKRIEYIGCPLDPQGTPLVEQIALVSSSFSTATENATNFTNPAAIISSGTKGANGQHAFASGFSLEWTRVDASREWLVKGAIGFDAKYAEDNDDRSVVRNPKALSFISLQWCD